ncbi:MAG: DUF4358 domain-containing protein [Desulfitobacteriaceae bacterium]|nr:DUF4358 domain-containing protein [Desulfitobacteriaceae bacterium]
MRRFLLGLSVVALSLMLLGCSHQTTDINLDGLIEDMLQNIEFQDELVELDTGGIDRLYSLGEGVSGRVFIGSGATAEEIAVFEAGGKQAAIQMREYALAHIDEQKQSFAGYLPKELKKLDEAIVLQYGKYVIVCVTDDADASGIIEAHFN